MSLSDPILFHFFHPGFGSFAVGEKQYIGIKDDDDGCKWVDARIKTSPFTMRLWIPGCNLRIVAALAEGLPIFYNSVVDAISYSSQGVAVYTQDTVFKGIQNATGGTKVLCMLMCVQGTHCRDEFHKQGNRIFPIVVVHNYPCIDLVGCCVLVM